MESLSIWERITSSGFEGIDFIILVVYLILLVSLGLFLSRNKDGKEKSANDYFLAGNTLTWSVEGYVHALRENADASADELALANAMLIYVDSAAAAMN